MDRQSIKKFLISDLYLLTNEEELKNNDINLFTPLGIISGKPYHYSTDNLNEYLATDLMAKLFEKITNTYKSKYSIENSIPENDGFIVLQDVIIRSNNSVNIIKVPQLVVFYDQIIGITLGNLTVGD